MERAAHQRKSSVGIEGLSQDVQAEVSQPGEQLPEHQEGWRQSHGHAQ